jgi:RimJ/RimL family protein N-acetyltransferase
MDLLLRQWKETDLEPYIAMNADPEVMRYFPALLSRDESVASFERLRRAIDQRGWGVWAVEVDGAFAGLCGLNSPSFDAPFMPCTEILWRLRPKFWGRSLGYRAALKALDFGFQTLKLREIVSFTAAINLRSRKLMERLQFQRDLNGNFEHPSIAVGHPIRLHVLYRLFHPASS